MPNIEHLKPEILLFESVTFTPEVIKQKLKKLKPFSAPGPDGFNSTLLIELSEELCFPLCLLFTKSMSEGSVPQEWKCANVTPIFKKGSKLNPGNYRPISLTCIICKIMESVIKDSLVEHLTKNNLIFNSQHGFMSKKSCLTNLLEYLKNVYEYIDQGHSVDVIYLDFAKAFDKVPHARLSSVLQAHGVAGEAVNWIDNWLEGRQQRVVLNGEKSEWLPVTSGVPQGSVIGPILFVIFINPLDRVIDQLATILSKFADDTKAGRVINCEVDRDLLQNAIDILLKWSEDWLMVFNASKCKVIHFGKNNPKYSYTMGGFAPGGTVLESTKEEKDVGVIISDTLKPSSQCAAAARKANQVLGQMSRSFHYRDRFTWILTYLLLVLLTAEDRMVHKRRLLCLSSLYRDQSNLASVLYIQLSVLALSKL